MQPKLVNVEDLMGPGEIAEEFGVRPNVVSNWRRRGVLPEPIIRLKMGPLWTRGQVESAIAIREAKSRRAREEAITRLERRLERLRRLQDAR